MATSYLPMYFAITHDFYIIHIIYRDVHICSQIKPKLHALGVLTRNISMGQRMCKKAEMSLRVHTRSS